MENGGESVTELRVVVLVELLSKLDLWTVALKSESVLQLYNKYLY
jgi:hypothetical protein